ncbi:hypothetical protein CGLO_16681 [Colletotrichum gloeosporioides Cg-14]|uniref:Uncharacterized protein n=1 Tax=Colletotrichum gloeosporioides (strain Cg-14) TaxID=1237896 RepID=T0JVJ3_COLGC|nr:hypothetical protein CGLO_16681 [Colletotrichum gloeosporioides Cg-14]
MRHGLEAAGILSIQPGRQQTTPAFAMQSRSSHVLPPKQLPATSLLEELTPLIQA